MTTPRPSLHAMRGLSAMGAVILLGIAAILGLGGYAGWSYYRLLDRVHRLSTCLDKIHRHRGTARVTAATLRDKTLAAVRDRGGQVTAQDVTVTMTALTLQNASSLPALWRTRLNMACYHKRLQDVQDTRIANRVARIRGQPQRVRPRPSTAPPPLRPDAGVACDPERLAGLDFTFVRVQARARVQVGWFHRTVRLERRFFLDQPPQLPGEDEEGEDAADAAPEDEENE